MIFLKFLENCWDLPKVGRILAKTELWLILWNIILPANTGQGNTMVLSFMYVSDKTLFETLQSSTAIHFFTISENQKRWNEEPSDIYLVNWFV